jgi:hypothetical protein
MPNPRAPIEERLARRLVLRDSGCLEWTGFTTVDGYGHIAFNKTMIETHRLAWTLVNGAIPPGVKVLHHCDNPPCCQTAPTEGFPDGHLFPGTQADNVADMMAKGRHVPRGTYASPKTHCKQGHSFDEANTYVGKNGRRNCRACNRVAVARYKARTDVAS